MTALVKAGTFVVEAHANWGAWAAKCGRCINGTPFRHAPGYLRPGTPSWECWLCGAVTEVIWPSEKTMRDVERLLMMRPDPTTRNWLPGESVQDLMWENAEHGILDQFKPLHVAAKPGTEFMVIDDDGIRLDNLPMIKPRIRRELT
jgi:hypothetical protein